MAENLRLQAVKARTVSVIAYAKILCLFREQFLMSIPALISFLRSMLGNCYAYEKYDTDTHWLCYMSSK